MRAIIMAAGKGTRMLPLTKNCPKALLRISENVTVLDLLILNCLRAKDIEEIVVVVNNRHRDDFILWNKYDKVTIVVSPIEDNLIECIRCLVDQLSGSDVLIAASDNVLDFEIQRFIDFFMQDTDKCAVMYYYEESIFELRRTGVALIEDGIVVDMEEKPTIPKYNYAIPPFYIISESHIDCFERFIRSNIEVDSLGTFLSWYIHETEVRAYTMPGRRYNLGSKEAYLKYKKTLSKRIEANEL